MVLELGGLCIKAFVKGFFLLREILFSFGPQKPVMSLLLRLSNLLLFLEETCPPKN